MITPSYKDDYNYDMDAPVELPPRRQMQPGDLEFLHKLWGDHVYLVRPPMAYVYEGSLSSEMGELTATGIDEEGVVHIFIPTSSLTRMQLVHEYGHAIHLLHYPESEYWPKSKCEAFAHLPAMRAIRHWGLLSDEERNMVAKYIRLNRRNGLAAHKKGLKLAWEAVWAHRLYADQQDYIANAKAEGN